MQLLKSDEHKKLIKQGNEYDNILKEKEELALKLQQANTTVSDVMAQENALRQMLSQKK